MQNITPLHLRCQPEDGCPAVHVDGDDLLIVAKIDHNQTVNVDDGECVVRIRKEFFPGLTIPTETVATDTVATTEQTAVAAE